MDNASAEFGEVATLMGVRRTVYKLFTLMMK
jgi:hypothetical protein